MIANQTGKFDKTGAKLELCEHGMVKCEHRLVICCKLQGISCKWCYLPFNR
jgi:hypothetical protein